MKMPVQCSDGVFKGGLYNTATHNWKSCRVWWGRPQPGCREYMIDVSGHAGPSSEGSWLLVRLAYTPDLSGASDGSDTFDGNSYAMRLSVLEAARWFERQDLAVPPDLTELVKNSRHKGSTNVQMKDAVTPPKYKPLTEAQRVVWDALMGRIVSGKELAKELGSNEEAIRKRIQAISASGRTIVSARGAGYYRGDCPPPDTAV